MLEREAQPVIAGLEPFLVTAVPDPRALDVFRCGGARDESGAWGTFFRAVAQKIITRAGDNTYVIRDAALRGVLHVIGDDGRLAQGLPNIISRVTTDPTLRRALDEMFLAELQRHGKNAIVQGYLAVMHSASEHVPSNAVSKFRDVGMREVSKLLPECRIADDAARLVGFIPPTDRPRRTVRSKHRALSESSDGNGSAARDGLARIGSIPGHPHD